MASAAVVSLQLDDVEPALGQRRARDLDQVAVVGEDQHLRLGRQLGERGEDPLGALVVGLQQDVVEEDRHGLGGGDVALDRGEAQREEELLAGAVAQLRHAAARAVGGDGDQDVLVALVDVGLQARVALAGQGGEERVGARQQRTLVGGAVAGDRVTQHALGEAGAGVALGQLLDLGLQARLGLRGLRCLLGALQARELVAGAGQRLAGLVALATAQRRPAPRAPRRAPAARRHRAPPRRRRPRRRARHPRGPGRRRAARSRRAAPRPGALASSRSASSASSAAPAAARSAASSSSASATIAAASACSASSSASSAASASRSAAAARASVARRCRTAAAEVAGCSARSAAAVAVISSAIAASKAWRRASIASMSAVSVSSRS